MISLLISLLFSNTAIALEIPSDVLLSRISITDQGPANYKNFSCAWYPWHRGHLCSWKNRVTKESYQIKGQEAANLLQALEDHGAIVKCNTSPWGEVCEAYYYSVICNDLSCKMKAL